MPRRRHFTVTIPTTKLDTYAELSTWQSQHGAVRILIVDDDAINRAVLAQQFHHADCNILSGHEAVEALLAASEQKKPYQVLLVDDGVTTVKPVELIKFIKTISRIPELLCILISQPVSQGLAQLLQQAGYAEQNTKPVLPQQLHTELNQLWEQWLYSKEL